MPRKSKEYADDIKQDNENTADKPETGSAKPEKAGKAPKPDKLKEELEAANDRLLRLGAEFDNYKKRTERERMMQADHNKSTVLKAILPAVDNIEAALAADSGAADYAKGIEMTMKQLKDAFGQLGLEDIDPQGEPFDPQQHEAVMHDTDDSLPENTVSMVLKKGYKLGGTVLRPAMVKVVN